MVHTPALSAPDTGSLSYVLEVGVSLLGPADAVECYVGSSVVPVGPKAGLGNFGELQVLRSRYNVWGEMWGRGMRGVKEVEMRFDQDQG